MARRKSTYYDSYYPHFSQPSAEELRIRAMASVKEAQKGGKTLDPVTAPSRGSICTSWWGKAWCQNLESYADYSNRLSRGRRYLSTGTVLDLQVGSGVVNALVQGSSSRPYKVKITIDPLPKAKAEAIYEKCSCRIENLEKLVSGEFPMDLKDLFTSRSGGLFPSPREIHLSCSCPDWATMCKHVAAVMYGIGVRFDQNPFYFFLLRGLDVDTFVDTAIANGVEAMLKNADKKSSRVIEGEDLTELFGVVED